ncbi:MAG: hypothetical protein JWL90_4499 [Chthoniobacteraceae bacterium]|nr:hypothetical protein [Chthoniobacteraceae bacterium]
MIDRSRFHQGAVREVAAMLPADDAELDRWIDDVVLDNDQPGFVYGVVAALSCGRRVDARHLTKGTMLMPNILTLGCVAWHMDGDVAEHLLTAVQRTLVARDSQASALLVAAAWCLERRNGELPSGLITQARLLARTKELSKTGMEMLCALAGIVRDEGFSAVLAQHDKWKLDQSDMLEAQSMGQRMLRLCRAPILDIVPQNASNDLARGFTMRRAVARIGRNESCPCGSNEKYKRCCFDKDQQRLHLSCDVAGKTAAEVRADPERYLTKARLDKTQPYELARLDPCKIDPQLLQTYTVRLAAFSLFERIAEAYEKLGCPEPLKEVWAFILFYVTRAGRKDIVERLMKTGLEFGCDPAEVHPGTRLLMMRDEPAAFLSLLDELAREAVMNNNEETLSRFATGIMISDQRALGILIARGILPITDKKDALYLFEQMLESRDKLNLSPDDPFSDLIDARFMEEESEPSADAEALRVARHRLESKAAEVRQLKEALEQLRGEIEHREEKPPAPAAVQSCNPLAPLDEGALHLLREKVNSLKCELKQRHNERAVLRRELEKMHTDLESLRQFQARHDTQEHEEVDEEEALILPSGVSANQPVRLIEFPRKFHQALALIPRQTARATLAILGRLAGGEPAAFVGVVRLKACPDILRQRIGIHHRLLFRLQAEQVQVVDVINRKDLSRRIKSLG